MPPALLLTQCLQDDFVKPIGRFDPLPNLLHVGHAEARRLLGENPEEGPVALLMRWAHEQPDDALRILHVRDWHDPDDPAQATHLQQFGHHCIRDTPGASFAFPDAPESSKQVELIDSLTLNDFNDTDLAERLAPFADRPVRVGIIGVWTEAKVSFLAYELATRYPRFELATCSALTAGSSRAQHFVALDQLERLLGVHVFSSIGRFIEFLGGEADDISLPTRAETAGAEIVLDERTRPSDTDRELLRYLFRDCKRVRLRQLDGGFSGNLVLGSESEDMFGHLQVPHVIKIGPQEMVGRERAAFERIESVLGNSAPQVTDFADLGDRGAIKYRYASMGGGFSQTFQALYADGLPATDVERILRTVYEEQLGRLYAAATLESANLLEYYCFSSRWASNVRERVEGLTGASADGATIALTGGRSTPNPCIFYESELDSLPRRAESAYFAYVHGDLNGANIIVDAQQNVWLIDFFHAHHGHVLKDLIKLENDLLYIFTEVADDDVLQQAFDLTDRLLDVQDLARPLPSAEECAFQAPALRRAWETLRVLRGFYPELVRSDRDPLQVFIGMMRYAVHTLGFDESDHRQKLWALYTAGRCGERIATRLRARGPLRVDWIDERHAAPGRVGLTLLPGRRDVRRDLDQDVATLKELGVQDVAVLVTHGELRDYGVDGLMPAYERAGIHARHLPVVDQSVSTPEEMRELVRWAEERTEKGRSVLMHCVGGLGRSGTAAACYLRARGLDAEAAIEEVRRARSRRAIESERQERFVREFVP